MLIFVLNLIINGLPSILIIMSNGQVFDVCVLNLIINGLPSIQEYGSPVGNGYFVLNLIINGLPSILNKNIINVMGGNKCFKPYYKWITFNTQGI